VPCTLHAAALSATALGLVVSLSGPALARAPIPTQAAIPRGSWSARLLPAARYLAPLRAAQRALSGQGLVELRRDLPTILIPDLHGRRDYLDAVLATRDGATGKTYLELLRRGQVQVVCLGDLMHTEVRGELWRRGMPDVAMRLEMAESLGTVRRVAELKAAFPSTFHVLRGNHDDVGPAGAGAPCDLPLQIGATRRFLGEKLGQGLVDELSRFFCALPVAAAGASFAASHAPPLTFVARAEVKAGGDRSRVAFARIRVPSFNAERAAARALGESDEAILDRVARELTGRDASHYIHGHFWARPMTIRGREVFFGNPSDRTFMRIDAGQPLQPLRQLFEAGSGRLVPVPSTAVER
jgi:hypothetical protein